MCWVSAWDKHQSYKHVYTQWITHKTKQLVWWLYHHHQSKPINCMTITMIGAPNFLIFRVWKLEIKKVEENAVLVGTRILSAHTLTHTHASIKKEIRIFRRSSIIESKQYFSGVWWWWWCCWCCWRFQFFKQKTLKIVFVKNEKSFHNISVPFNFLFPLITFTYILNCFSKVMTSESIITSKIKYKTYIVHVADAVGAIRKRKTKYICAKNG